MSSSKQLRRAQIFTINCNGAPHRIALMPNGQMVALDHSPKLGRERRFMELGGAEPACHQTIRVLFSARDSRLHIPPDLKSVYHTALSKRSHRMGQRLIRRYANSGYPSLFSKYQALSHLALLSVFPSRCRYAWGSQQTTYRLPNPGSYSINVFCYRDTGDDRPWAQWDRKTLPDPGLFFHLPLRWYRTVYKAGLSVLNGHLVVTANTKPDGELVGLMLTQPDPNTMDFAATSYRYSAGSLVFDIDGRHIRV